MSKKKTPDEKIVSLRDKIAKKQSEIQKSGVTLANAQAKIDAAKKAVESFEKQISAIEADMLGKTLHDKGIDISQIIAAIEAGTFDKPAPEKPPENPSKKQDNGPEITDKGGATYSTENKTDKEDLNE